MDTSETLSVGVVLVVDDVPSIRSLLTELLQYDGYEVVEAANGRRAIEILDERPVDMVITDVRMPEVSGRGLYEYVEQHHHHLLGKFIVITGHPGADADFFRQRARVPVLDKPFRWEALRSELHARRSH